MTKIDDEMVERAVKAFGWTPTQLGSCRVFQTDAPHIGMRKALEAALSPKPGPEIEVSEGMLKDGRAALISWWLSEDEDAQKSALKSAYRAMESTRLKEAAYAAKSTPQGVNAGAPEKATGGGVGMVLIKDRRIQLERRTASDSYSDWIARLTKYGRERRHGLKRRSTDPK